MTVIVTWPSVPRRAGRAVTSGRGAGEVFVHVVSGDDAMDAVPDRTLETLDDVELITRPEVRAPDRGADLGSGSGTDLDPAADLDVDLDVELSLDLDADAAVARLYAQQWTPLVRLAALLTRDASVAEEIVQDAFVQLHQRWDRLSDRSAAPAYLRTSVVNRARSALRHRGVEERYRQPGAPAPAGPEERAVQADADARVMAALRTLSRRQQEVLVLRYYADLSEQDIAATLGLSKGAVKSHAHRGLAALRAALAGERAGAPGGDVGGDAGAEVTR